MVQNKVSEFQEKEFVFRGEVLALDLVNTVVVVRGKQVDLLATPADLALWWEAANKQHPGMDMVLSDPPTYDADLLVSIKELRSRLRRLFVSIIQGQEPDEADIDSLNGVLQIGYPAIHWRKGRQPEAVYGVHGDSASALLLPVSLSAHYLLTQGDFSRLHQCHNRRCILLFYDTSKSGTRQWCSTACFDRERSSQRYEEKKRSR